MRVSVARRPGDPNVVELETVFGADRQFRSL
jgi:hypothetical protein